MKHLHLQSIHHKFFYSMCISSITIVIIITMTLNLVFFYFFINTQTKNSKVQLHSIKKQLEFFTTSICNYSRTIASSSLIQEFGIQYKKEHEVIPIMQYQVIKSEIGHIIQSTPYIHSVSLYDTNFDFVLSTENFHTPSEYKRLIGIEKGIWLPSLKKVQTNHNLIDYTFSYITPFYSIDTGEPIGYIEVALLESEIKKIYSENNHLPNTIFLVDSQGMIQSTHSSQILRTPYPIFDKLTLAPYFYYQMNSGYGIFSEYIEPLNFYIIEQVPITTFFKPIFLMIALGAFISIFCITLYVPIAHRITHTITSPIRQLIEHTKQVKAGYWTPLHIQETDSDVSSLIVSFNHMLIAQEDLKNKLIASQKEKNKMALNLLQEQINPHFLYNTLDNICALAEIGEIDLLNQLIFNLSNFYRKGLSHGQAFITISEELEMIRSYLAILQIRYYNRFDFEIQCEPELLSLPCLKFLLQPIVENSIYHGIKSLPHKGFLSIRVTKKQQDLFFYIQDNGVGIEDSILREIWSSTKHHFGICNVHRRIQLYYGKDYGVSIHSTPHEGCLVILKIQLKEGGNFDAL